MTTNTNVALLAALEAAHDAIIGMKVEAETAAQGDEQMMLEACEQISNEGLEATTAIRAALTTAAAVPPEGVVMVPKVPDERMERAIAAAFFGTVHEARKAWVAGIAAAPKAEPVQAGEYPPLPRPFIGVQDQPWGGHKEVIRSAIGEDGVVSCYTDDQMRAYIDADRAMRAQAAPAPNAALYDPREVAFTAQAAPQPAAQQGDELPREDFAWLVVQEACETEPADEDDPECIRILRRDLKSAVLSAFLRHDAAHPAAPVAQGDALTDTYVQQVPDKCDRIVWRGRYYHLPIDAAEHSYTEPSPMAKVAAALRQKAEQEDAAYQARRSDQGLMESEWGPMEDAPPHEDPPMHVAVVEGDDAVRTLQWNRDVAAFAYPVGTLLYAARSQAKEGANHD